MSKEKSSNATVSKRPNRLLAFMRDDRTRYIFGLVLMLVGAWLAIAFTSFLSNAGKADSSWVDHHLTPQPQEVSNWTGSMGAKVARFCINDWIGVSSFLYIIFMLRLGYTMLRNNPLRPLFKVLVRYMIWSIWISLFCGVLFISSYKDTYLYLGGHHGYDLEQLLQHTIGYPGVCAVLVVTFLSLCAFVSRSTITHTRNVLDFFGHWRERQAAKAAADQQTAAARAQEEELLRQEEESQTAAALTEEAEPQTGDETETPIGEEAEAPTGEETAPVASSDVAFGLDDENPEDESVAPVETGEAAEETAADDLPIIETTSEDLPEEEQEGTQAETPADPTFTVTTVQTEVVDEPIEMPVGDYDPTKDLEYYQFPTFNLLKEYDASTPVDMVEQNENKEKIRQTLSDYGVEIQSISATVGPTITLFEIVLVSGTKINTIKRLSDEIAMSIASRTGVRIIAPIPGKCAIGIEVPNKDPQTVSMRECIQSRSFQESKAALPVALGKTITNEVFTFDLAKAPHMLVAGATGQGKSVGLNAIITSLLYKKHPSQLKIVLVDPKMVEFSIYQKIDKHFLAKLPEAEDPIITDVNKVVETLKSLCAEMEDRYALLREAGVRKLEEYNEKFIHRQLNPKKHIDAPLGSKQGTNHHYLPYIVAIIDEYGDLIMTAGKEVELPIARIAQKARAVGIHMIIATQRPSAKIVTGIIKANFPARIAFRVSSATDSSIILDQSGAQNLVGRGDLFISLGDKFERVQCAFVDTPEVDRVNKFISEQQAYPTAYILPEPKPAPGEGGDMDGEGGAATVDLRQLDPLFAECAELVVASGQGSTSMVQRKFQIGYNRAGRIMDQLEAAGIVGPYQGSKARAVLVDSDSELRSIIDSLPS